ncbi:MAG: hypothetical protein EAZ24_09275, partial [Burkholderiales bacterium]
RGGSPFKQCDKADAPHFRNPSGRIQVSRLVLLRSPCGARTTAAFAPNHASKPEPPHSSKSY